MHPYGNKLRAVLEMSEDLLKVKEGRWRVIGE